jgi:hypothetical protein
MYFYSLALFAVFCLLIPAVHHRSPVGTITFAFLYLSDSLVNVLYTFIFAASWFLVLGTKHQQYHYPPISPIGTAIEDHNPSQLRQDSAGMPGATFPVGIGAGILLPESATSIFIIVLLWFVRLYFVMIVFASARQVVRASATPAEAPFEGRNNGEGWQGRLGRALVGVGRGYWEGTGWVPFGGSKFRRSTEPMDGRVFRAESLSV